VVNAVYTRNCIRSLMIEAAEKKGVRVRSVSFKGSVQALRQWEPHLNQSKMSRQEQDRLIQLLLDSSSTYVTSLFHHYLKYHYPRRKP
jgi:hypothetical protein